MFLKRLILKKVSKTEQKHEPYKIVSVYDQEIPLSYVSNELRVTEWGFTLYVLFFKDVI